MNTNLESNIQEKTGPQVKSGKIVLYRSVLAELPLILVTLITIVVGIYFTYTHESSIEYLDIYHFENWTLSIPIPLYAIIPILLTVFTLHVMYDCKYEIADDYVRSIKGLVSLTKLDHRIELNNLRGVDIHRNLYCRIVNVGTLRISSATHDNVEVCLYDIYNPSYYRDLIIERRKQARLEEANVVNSIDD